ncbi:hypothetical protein [Candidatus Kuenenia stuttgartiensis]|uniref:hypothetical protein n=1 Tax=Kuenenia stuttgartiensis TaxID=174633 RepID=UPI00146A472F|nr:hypothetical protein [Candidatus Kuenenia stuttgartiensis]
MKKDQKTKSFTPSPQWKVLIIFALFFIAIYMLQRYSISTSVPVRHTMLIVNSWNNWTRAISLPLP